MKFWQRIQIGTKQANRGHYSKSSLSETHERNTIENLNQNTARP